MATTPTSQTHPAGGSGGKYLTFMLTGETYGLRILDVREIVRMMPVTIVPNAPAFVRGVVNLRGKVLPVIDLRVKLGMPATDPTGETCIIIVHVRDLEMGLVVDKVCDVAALRNEDIADAPSFGIDANIDFIFGIARAGATVVILLDIGKVITEENTIFSGLADAMKS